MTAKRAQNARRFKWYHLYFLLAAFDLITIGVTLYLSHSILGIYTESVNNDQEWAERLGRFYSLGELAAAVNTPGNDVFESNQVDKEADRLEQFVSLYHDAAGTARADLEANVSSEVSSVLTVYLDKIDFEISQIQNEASNIFDALRASDRDAAGSRMAMMDQHFSKALGYVSDLCRNVREIQGKHFLHETARAEFLGQFEIAIGAVVLLIVCGVSWYGHNLANQMTAAERRISENQKHIRAIVDTSLDCIVSMDKDGLITEFNPTAERVFGYTRDEVMGGNVAELLMPQGQRGNHLSGVKRYLETGESKLMGRRVEIIAMRSNGEEFPAELALSVAEVNESPVFTASISDISERKRAEEERRSLQHDLVDTARRAGMAEIATGVLHNVGNVLNSVNVSTGLLQEEVGRSVSHDLEQLSKLLDDQGDDIDKFFATDKRAKHVPVFMQQICEGLGTERESFRDGLQNIQSHLDHIKTIVSMQQSIASSKTVVERVDLGGLVADAITFLKSSLDKYGVQVERQLEELPLVMVDRHRIMQILVNLIKNAQEASLDPTDARISIGLTKSDDEIRISVVDSGMGIEPDHLTDIFGHGFTTKDQGHGFGLHSCANFANEMGGSLKAYSDGPNQGAEFVLTLPFNPAEELCAV